MRKLVFVGLTGSIALTVVGCSSHARVSVTTTPAPASPDSPETSTAPQPFDAKSAAALVPQVSAPEHIPGLVQATNGDERAKQIQRIIDREKRQDPFAAVPVTLQQPIPSLDRAAIPLPDRAATPLPNRAAIPFNRLPFSTPTPRQAKPRKQTPASRVAYYPYFPPVKPLGVGSKPSVSIRPKQVVTAQGGQNNPVITIPRRQQPVPVQVQAKQNRPIITVLPPLPGATLANAVEVSGVVVVGKVTQVIVKAPNETSSRHIQVGQRLANGQVLVKRVELSDGVEPIVILEVNGIEVAKTLGA